MAKKISDMISRKHWKVIPKSKNFCFICIAQKPNRVKLVTEKMKKLLRFYDENIEIFHVKKCASYMTFEE